MTDHELPDSGDYVEVTFEGDHGNQSSIKGRVTDVDTDPDGGYDSDGAYHATLATVTVDEGHANQTAHVYVCDGLTAVNRYDAFSGHLHLGENADWRVLE